MSEEVKEEVVVEETKEEKKGFFAKAKDAILPDPEEQAAIISTFVRITVLAWSGGFIASVFTGVLASFGIQTASKKGDGTMKMNGNGNGGTPPPTAKEIEQIVAKASAGGPVQTIRIEQE